MSTLTVTDSNSHTIETATWQKPGKVAQWRTPCNKSCTTENAASKACHLLLCKNAGLRKLDNKNTIQHKSCTIEDENHEKKLKKREHHATKTSSSTATKFLQLRPPQRPLYSK